MRVGLLSDSSLHRQYLSLSRAGVGAGGSKGPYTQSDRLDIYRHHCNQLLSVCPVLVRHVVLTDRSRFTQEGKAYECFCTPDELQAIKMTLKRKGEKRNYNGRCSHLTEEDVGRRKRAGHKHVVRFKVSSIHFFSDWS